VPRTCPGGTLGRGEGDRCGLADRGWFRLGFPEVEGRRTTAIRVSNRFVEWVLTAACESGIQVVNQSFRVTGRVDPPACLLSPPFIARVAKVNLLRRQRDSQPRPAEVADRVDDRMPLPDAISD
jgi:hypothetical protein